MMYGGATPVVPISVRLPIVEQDALTKRVASQIALGLEEVLHRLGIPGVPRVEIRGTPPNQIPQVFVDGYLQAYPQDMVRNLWEALIPSRLGSLPPGYAWKDWLKEHMLESSFLSDIGHINLISEFLARLVVEIVTQRPDRLFAEAQAAFYLEQGQQCASGAPSSNAKQLQAKRLVNIVRPVLKWRLSIADRALVMQRISGGMEQELADEDIAEMLIRTLRPRSIRIKIHPNYLETLIHIGSMELPLSVYDPRVGSEVHRLFARLTEKLFDELGIHIQDLTFEPDESLQDGVFAVAVNHLYGVPRRGVSPDQLLINGTPEQLQQVETPTLRASRAGTDTADGIMAQPEQGKAQPVGLALWSPLASLIDSLTRTLRNDAAYLVDSEVVEFELATLHRTYPHLAMAAVQTISLPRLTHILRMLLSEQISIRSLDTILERVLTFGYIVVDPGDYLILDDRLPILEHLNLPPQNDLDYHVQHIRIGLQRYISNKYTQGRNTVEVYRLASDLEGRLLEHAAAEKGNVRERHLTTEEMENIRAAVRTTVAAFPPGATLPPILTNVLIRASVRRLLAEEFPDLGVLAEEELLSGLAGQTVAIISMKHAEAS